MKWKTRYVKSLCSDDGAHTINVEVVIFNEHYNDPHAFVEVSAWVEGDTERRFGSICDMYMIEKNINQCVLGCNTKINAGKDVRKHVKLLGFKLKR